MPLARREGCPFSSGPSISSTTPTGLPRADPDGVERVHLTVLGDAKKVDPKGGAKAGWQTLSSRNRCIPTPAKIATPSASGGIRWSSCPYSVSMSSPTLAVLAFASAYRRWVPRGKNVDVLHLEWAYFDKSWHYPTSRCTHEVPCLGTWSRVGQHDCFRVKTGLMAGAERGNTVRAGGICGPRDECSLAAGWLPRSSESS